MSEGLRKRRRPYLNVPSAAVNDRRLSYKARGIHHYLLDKPAGWDVRSLAIAGDSDADGKDSVQAGLRELARLGYYRIERRRLRDGRLLTGTAVSEYPDPVWADQYAEHEGPVDCVQQMDGTFRVRRKDGTLVPDGFEDDEDPFDPNGGVCAGQAGTGFPGTGPAGSGAAGSGQTGAGPAGTGKPRASTNTEEPLREPPVPSGGSARSDVERLCDHLAGLIEANGSRRPTVTKKWRDACRLLLDADGRSEEQIRKAIDWCQADEFWRANVMSMPTLREKYDMLRLRAQAKRNGDANGRNQSPRVDYPDEEYGSGFTPRSA
jgi:hypothetical protein